jgi:hypothetical protein
MQFSKTKAIYYNRKAVNTMKQAKVLPQKKWVAFFVRVTPEQHELLRKEGYDRRVSYSFMFREMINKKFNKG